MMGPAAIAAGVPSTRDTATAATVAAAAAAASGSAARLIISATNAGVRTIRRISNPLRAAICVAKILA
jgi:hypothetical protein